MEALSELYQEIILSHNRRPHHEGELDPRTGEAEGFNPLCGDRIRVFVRVRDGRLEAVRFVGESCAIARASASIMTDDVTGRGADEALGRVDEIVDLLTAPEDSDVDLGRWGDLAALAGVRRFPARIKCATLAWHTLASALRQRDGAAARIEV